MRGSDAFIVSEYNVCVIITDPPWVSGNCEAITQGMPALCNCCTRLPEGSITLPALPLSQAESVTTAGV